VLAWSLVQRNTKFDFYANPTVPEDKDAMSEQLLKDAKIIRRNAKAVLTRATKSLRHLIQSKRPGKEVSDVLFKVQKAYETLIDKHEEFTKLIEDDKEFEEQEAWLEESQYMFMSLETYTKLHLESTKEVQKEFKDKESQLSDNEASYENTSSSEISKSSISSSDNADNQVLRQRFQQEQLQPGLYETQHLQKLRTKRYEH